MPIVATEIPETYLSVTRPVVTNLVKDLINRFNLPNTTETRYTGNAEKLANEGSLLTDKNNQPLFGFKGKVDVVLDEEYMDEYAINTSIKRFNNVDVFTDTALEVRMFPIYTRVKNTITFTYLTSSKREVEKARDRLRRKTSEGMESLLHEVNYHYAPPTVYHDLLKEIYDKRENIGGYGESFQEYLKNHYNYNLTVFSNLDGTRGLPVFIEKQIMVQGWFDFEAQPDKATKTEEGDLWELSFSYTIEYDKITGMCLKYPIVVHNQLIDVKYIPNYTEYDPYEQKQKPSFTNYLNQYFSVLNYSKESPYKGIVIPHYDDWQPDINSGNLFPIISALVGVEQTDPRQLLNLNDLGELELDIEIINFIAANKQKVTDYLSSVLNISFFRNKSIQDKANFYIDDQMNLRSTKDLNIRNTYHVHISVLTNFRLLREKAKKDLLNNPTIFLKIVDFLDKALSSNTTSLVSNLSSKNSQTMDYNTRTKYKRRNSSVRQSKNAIHAFSEEKKVKNKLTDYIEIIGGRMVTKKSFEEITSRLPSKINLGKVGQGRGLHSVMSAGIVVHKK